MRPAPPLVLPPPLRAGSTIGVCAPAGPVGAEELEVGIAWWQEQGYQIRRAPNLGRREGYLAGTDDERLSDLCGLLRDRDVRAIFPARGGYGISRLLRRLDPAELRCQPKLWVGYSDATSLFLLLRERAGLAAVHGPMLERSDVTADARRRLLALLCGGPEAFEPLSGKPLAGGRAEGPLVGGNLTLLAASLGTPWEIDTRGAVLFLEEVGEQPYAIDRLLGQLRDAGKLAAAAGVALGQLVDCQSERYPEISACDVARELLTSQVEGPVVGDLPFGHVADNRALGVGVRAALDGDRGTLELLDPVVRDVD